MSGKDLRKFALEIVEKAIKAADPYFLINEQIKKDGPVLRISGMEPLDLDAYKRVFICGAGKGTAPMARAMEELLGTYLTGGDIIVKYDHRDQ